MVQDHVDEAMERCDVRKLGAFAGMGATYSNPSS